MLQQLSSYKVERINVNMGNVYIYGDISSQLIDRVNVYTAEAQHITSSSTLTEPS
jgi:hypothetical protein